MSTHQPLEPRRRPAGARARKTVDRILTATASLLDEVGFDDLNTNAIAERAEVNVASLYQYFPNKYAVLMALADRMRDEQLEMIATEMQPGGVWRERLRGLLDAYLRMFVSRPGFAELAVVMSSSPALREVDAASLAAETRLIADGLVAYGVEGSRGEREAIARVMLEASRGVLPLARRAGPTQRKRLMRELTRMLEGYLAGYIEG